MQAKANAPADFKYPKDFANEVAKQLPRFQSSPSALQNEPTRSTQQRRILLRGVESAFPDLNILEELSAVLYHVSFLTEESRKLAVRVSYLMPEDFKSKSPDDQLIHDPPVIFSQPRPFTASEVMRQIGRAHV